MSRTKGTQTVMTEETCAAILKTIKLGLHPDRAAESHGVSSSTLAMHKRRNPDYVRLIKEAESGAERGFLGRIIGHTDKQWTAAAWILERRWPERWAKREPTMTESTAEKITSQMLDANRRIAEAGGA